MIKISLNYISETEMAIFLKCGKLKTTFINYLKNITFTFKFHS